MSGLCRALVADNVYTRCGRSPTIERPADAGTDGWWVLVSTRWAQPCPRARRDCFPPGPALSRRVCRSCRRPRPTPERVPKRSRASGSEAGERGAKRTASDAPAHSPAAEVGAMPTWHRNSLGSRAGSPTRATCWKAIFSRSSPPYPNRLLKRVADLADLADRRFPGVGGKGGGDARRRCEQGQSVQLDRSGEADIGGASDAGDPGDRQRGAEGAVARTRPARGVTARATSLARSAGTIPHLDHRSRRVFVPQGQRQAL
jgi:hypothetical protein